MAPKTNQSKKKGQPSEDFFGPTRAKKKPAAKAGPAGKSPPAADKKEPPYNGLHNLPRRFRPLVDDAVACVAVGLHLAAARDVSFPGAYLGEVAFGRRKRHVFHVDRVVVTDVADPGDFIQEFPRESKLGVGLVRAVEGFLTALAGKRDVTLARTLLDDALDEMVDEPAAEEPVVRKTILQTAATTAGRQNLIEFVRRETGNGSVDEEMILVALRTYGGWKLPDLAAEEKKLALDFDSAARVSVKEAAREHAERVRVAIAARKFEPTTVVENMLAQIASETPPPEGTADSPETRAEAAPDEMGASGKVTRKELEAVAAALGRDVADVEEDRVVAAYEHYRDDPLFALQNKLDDLEKKFEEAGGRGVELADQIDDLRAVIAVRRVRQAK